MYSACNWDNRAFLGLLVNICYNQHRHPILLTILRVPSFHTWPHLTNLPPPPTLVTIWLVHMINACKSKDLGCRGVQRTNWYSLLHMVYRWGSPLGACGCVHRMLYVCHSAYCTLYNKAWVLHCLHQTRGQWMAYHPMYPTAYRLQHHHKWQIGHIATGLTQVLHATPTLCVGSVPITCAQCREYAPTVHCCFLHNWMFSCRIQHT